MLSFKQFIKEEEALKLQRGKRSAVFSHEDVVDGHPVNTSFSRMSPKKTGEPRSYSADFEMDGDMVKPKEGVKGGAKGGARILRHVFHRVSDFVGSHKPNQLHIQANSPEKVSLYKTFAQRLATKHGGRVEEYNHPEGHPLEGIPKYIVHLPGKKPK